MMSSWHGGKGSGRRKKDHRNFSNNYDLIFGKKIMEVVIYSAPHCVHCETVKNLSKASGYSLTEFDIGDLTPNEWKEKIGFVPRSVPQVFFNGEYIGGSTNFIEAVKNVNSE